MTDTLEQLMMDHRGVEDPCHKCRGTGVRTYASTATWRGGMGGAMMTHAECDHCWGSGDEHRPWTDLRALARTEEALVAARAADLFADRCGARFTVLRPSVEAVCAALDVMARKRKPPTARFDLVCSQLAKVLREALAAHP